MRIALLSDMHLSVNAVPFPAVEADIVVLAGDIARPAKAIEWARACPVPLLYVAGNHEFYGSDLVSTYEQLNSLSQGTQIHVLERSEYVHDGVRFSVAPCGLTIVCSTAPRIGRWVSTWRLN